MQPQDSKALQDITAYLQCLMTRGMEKAENEIPRLEEVGESDEVRELLTVFADFTAMLHSSYDFQKKLAEGDLDAEIDRRNYLVMPLRAFQASLKHLNWQASRVAKGDLNQQVHFLGDFSDSFNSMIEALKEKETLKDKLQAARKMEALGLMAGGVAHDLNNILTGIVSYPELILLDLPQDSELRESIESILESGQRAATVVADLLTIARNAASKKISCDLHTLIKEYRNAPECRKLRSTYPEITFKPLLSAEHPCILCSPVHVKRCLMNLVKNAAEVFLNDGKIVVSTENKHVDDTTAKQLCIDPGKYVVLRVQDDGSGISARDLEHIFEPFYTKKIMGRSGTGLGLTIIWNTMEDHGGTVLVESSDTGTCFQLYFPSCKEEQPASSDNDKPELHLATNNEYILIVDDDPQLRDIASKILNILGYRVDSVCSGELAIKFLETKSVDLLILDMQMDPGMNGRQTYEKILEMRPGQKALIASGFSENDDVKIALQLGAAEFIKKPYSIDELGRAVKEALQ